MALCKRCGCYIPDLSNAARDGLCIYRKATKEKSCWILFVEWAGQFSSDASVIANTKYILDKVNSVVLANPVAVDEWLALTDDGSFTVLEET